MDSLVKRFGAHAPRRQVLRGLGALGLGALGGAGVSSRAEAGCHHNGMCPCRKHESRKQCKRRCLRQCG